VPNNQTVNSKQSNSQQQTVKQQSSKTAKQSNSQTAKQPNNETAKQPTVKQPTANSQTIKQVPLQL
jgi:hypothetical protein